METFLLGVLVVLVLVLLVLQLRSRRDPLGQTIQTLQTSLTELSAAAKAREDRELQTAGSIRRLELIIAGTQSKGAAGENVVEAVFSQLPAEWQLRNFRVGNRTVEFGLRLPNGQVLPIDSKWAATSLLEQFAATQDLPGKARLKSEIERSVLEKVREVRRYLDPDLTPGFGVAVVPDSVYDLCAGIHAEAFRLRVVLVSYSMFVPYLLLVFQTTLRAGNDIDLKKLDAHLRTAQESVNLIQEELEGRFARSLTMLSNARMDIGLHLSKVSSALTSLQLAAPRAGETPALPNLGLADESPTYPDLAAEAR